MKSHCFIDILHKENIAKGAKYESGYYGRGQGSRLRPLTCDLPKPMVPIVNYPVMEYIINLLKKHGVTEIAVTSYYMTKYIEDYFENGEKWGVNLKYFVEEEPLGYCRKCS